MRLGHLNAEMSEKAVRTANSGHPPVNAPDGASANPLLDESTRGWTRMEDAPRLSRSGGRDRCLVLRRNRGPEERCGTAGRRNDPRGASLDGAVRSVRGQRLARSRAPARAHLSAGVEGAEPIPGRYAG